LKIAIIGSGGAGKSTLARKLGHILKIPVYHLDKYYWHPGWVSTPGEEWTEFQQKMVLEDHWIIDGNYGSTMDIRLKAADTIIYLDYPPLLAILRAIKRRIQYHGRTRPDLNEGCPESFDWQFFKWIWTFRKLRRPGILKLLEDHRDKKTIIIKTPGQARKAIAGIKAGALDEARTNDRGALHGTGR
jgi:adenylate kinase family enzyme